MAEFAKIVSVIKMWGWGRAGMILATALLFRHAVTFDQAVILILLNVVLDRLVYGKQPSPQTANGDSSDIAQNRRRRPKPINPCEEPDICGTHRTPSARRMEKASVNR